MDTISRSDWIALIACIGTLLGLVYPFRQMYHEWKTKKEKAALEASSPSGSEKKEEEPPEPPGALMRALVLTAMAFTFFVVELVVFSWLASFFGVAFNFSTMPANWVIGFISLFVVPGMLLLLALYNFSAAFDD